MFAIKKLRGTFGSKLAFNSSSLFLSILIVMLSLAMIPVVIATEPDESTLAEDTMKLLEEPLTREFGRPMPGVIVYEKHQSIVHVIGIDYQLEPGELDPSWGEKVVRALKAAGASNAKITMHSSWGPVEVQAENVSVGDKKAVTIQFTVMEDDNLIICSTGFPEM
jgi:hypothetical protein